MNKFITLKGETTVDVRTEEYLGRTWTIVPVVALVEGVMQAMNAATPELVVAEVYSKIPDAWNGRPVFIGHPLDAKGRPIAGNTPETLEALAFGQVFDAKVIKGKLAMEAWLDNERASVVPNGQALLDRIAEKEPIEVSVGAYVDTVEEIGEFAGKAYGAKWVDIVPEHLALLVEGDVGACSRTAGCGVRAAKGVTVKTIDKTNGSLFSRIMSAFRTAQPAADMSDNDVRAELAEAVREKDPRATYIEAVYDDYVVYCVYTADYTSMEYYKRPYTLAADGTVTLGDAVEVEPVLSYEPVDPAAEVSAAVKAAPCKCHETPAVAAEVKPAEEKNMKREDIVTKLEKATDAQLESIGKVFEAPAPAVVETPTVAVAKTPTFEEVLALSTPDVQATIKAAQKDAADKKAATIASLKASGRNTFSDEALAVMSQDALDSIVKLADVKVAVDFSGKGAAKDQSQKAEDVPAAPSLVDALKAAKR